MAKEGRRRGPRPARPEGRRGGSAAPGERSAGSGATWPSYALVLALAVLPFLNTLDAPFLYDDTIYVVDNPHVRGFASVGTMLRSSYPPGRPAQGLYRPATTISYYLDHALAGLEPRMFHLTNVVLHGLATLALFALLRSYWPAPSTLDVSLPFLAAAIFAVHPVHTEPVAWVVGRAEIICALFVFLALRSPWPLAFPAVLLALLAKEMAITAPVLALLPAFFLERSRITWARTGAAAAASAVYLVLRYGALGAFTPQGSERVLQGLSLVERLPAVGVAQAAYLRLLVFPLHLSADYRWAEVPTFGWPAAVVGLAALLFLTAIAIAVRASRTWLALGIAWFEVSLLPVSHLAPIGASYAERFLYLPSAGACVAIAGAVVAIRPPAWRRAVLAVLLVAAAARTVHRNQTWRSEERFYRETLQSSPDHATLTNNLGRLLAERGDLAEAERLFTRAVDLNPKLAPALSNLGVVRAQQRRFDEARSLLERAVAADPGYARGHNNLGNLLAITGDATAAAESYRKALAINPGYREAAQNLEKLPRPSVHEAPDAR